MQAQAKLYALACMLLIVFFAPHELHAAGGRGSGSGKSSNGSSFSGAKPSAQHNVPHRLYDAQGRYIGKVASDGRRFDSQGRYLGRTDDSGRQYDAQGRYRSKVDESGRRYDSQGRYEGRTDDTGKNYDAQGRYESRMAEQGARGSRLNRQGSPAQQKASTQEASKTIAPVTFCQYGDKDCK